MKLKYKSINKFIIQIFILTLGCMLMALATSTLLLPNKLSSGGFTGIATIIYYVFNVPMGVTIFILNLPLLILGLKKLGKEFLIKSIIGIVLYSIFLDIFDRIPYLTTDNFLACIYGGIMIGIGMALVLKSESSTGGTDLLTSIIRAYKKEYKASVIIIIIDVVIVGLNIVVFKNIEIGLYSAITIYLMGKMIDIIFEGIDFTKMIFIISDKYDKIALEISSKVGRGLTGLYAKGMYLNKEKMMLLCVGSRNQIGKIKKIVKDIDSKAFIVISNAREALGNGFKEE